MLALADIPGRVYPRVGGGTPSQGCGLVQGSALQGVYPRVGGGTTWSTRNTLKSIPAWAHLSSLSPKVNWVYPRVGGGTVGVPLITRSWWVYPSVGNLEPELHRVYPRVGGGTVEHKAMAKLTEGLSPRGRGNHVLNLVDVRYIRSIPAWAGEPHTRYIH